MSDKQAAAADGEASVPVTPPPGAELQAGREAANLGIAELGATLRLDQTVIRNIEADNYDELPAAIFTRGYIRNYAVAVGLDPEPLCAAYDAQTKAEEAALPQQEPQRKGRKTWFWLLLILLAAGALAWWYSGPRQEAIDTDTVMPVETDQEADAAAASSDAETNNEGNNTDSVSASEPTRPAVVAAFSVNGTEPTSSESSNDSSVDASPPEPAAVTETPQPAAQPAPESPAVVSAVNPVVADEPEPAAEPEPEAEEEAPAAENRPEAEASQEREEVATKTVDFRLDVSDDCWVKIIDGNGKIRVERTLKTDQFRELTAIAPVTFIIGNADIATLTIAGEEFDMAPHKRRTGLARFTVEAE